MRGNNGTRHPHHLVHAQLAPIAWNQAMKLLPATTWMVTQTGGSRKRDKLLPVSIMVMAEEEAAPTLAKDEKEILGLIAL